MSKERGKREESHSMNFQFARMSVKSSLISLGV
jgi:hypothetical protein